MSLWRPLCCVIIRHAAVVLSKRHLHTIPSPPPFHLRVLPLLLSSSFHPRIHINSLCHAMFLSCFFVPWARAMIIMLMLMMMMREWGRRMMRMTATSAARVRNHLFNFHIQMLLLLFIFSFFHARVSEKERKRARGRERGEGGVAGVRLAQLVKIEAALYACSSKC